jgi:hypothetical protein
LGLDRKRSADPVKRRRNTYRDCRTTAQYIRRLRLSKLHAAWRTSTFKTIIIENLNMPGMAKKPWPTTLPALYRTAAGTNPPAA